MLPGPGVVGRALRREVQRDFQPVLLGRGEEEVEILERAEFGVDGGVPPSAAPIAQGEPGSPGLAVSLLFGPLRWALPMGWMGGR